MGFFGRISGRNNSDNNNSAPQDPVAQYVSANDDLIPVAVPVHVMDPVAPPPATAPPLGQPYPPQYSNPPQPSYAPKHSNPPEPSYYSQYYNVEPPSAPIGDHPPVDDRPIIMMANDTSAPPEKNIVQRIWARERRLIVAIIILGLVLCVPIGHYILYPFYILAVWTHEQCHGIGALLMGGTIKKIHVYDDGGGMCWWSNVGDKDWKQAFAKAAGYSGTSIVGGFLLIFRRLKKGVKIATITLGSFILFSCVLWVRNKFGFFFMFAEGLVILAAGIFLPKGLGTLYAFLASTICMNSIVDCHILKGETDADDEWTSDAEGVSELIGKSPTFWALTWMVQAIIMLILGLLCALEADEREYYDYT